MDLLLCPLGALKLVFAQPPMCLEHMCCVYLVVRLALTRQLIQHTSGGPEGVVPPPPPPLADDPFLRVQGRGEEGVNAQGQEGVVESDEQQQQQRIGEARDHDGDNDDVRNYGGGGGERVLHPHVPRTPHPPLYPQREHQYQQHGPRHSQMHSQVQPHPPRLRAGPPEVEMRVRATSASRYRSESKVGAYSDDNNEVEDGSAHVVAGGAKPSPPPMPDEEDAEDLLNHDPPMIRPRPPQVNIPESLP